ncbi:zinc metalloproteinase nas-13-like isoform X2 [Leptopilina boulardi]|uniref:zinc metalloproteinase nas-13-like isoform X1 n=1 Tax=Leptopilina boulardi TaxID=63433 RepID=UPI0021F5ED9A|nr:zinc metalloproteinase nas-13-like isoform X1 [Leptopilina boulardi]XP_051160829.1 zinc metalloproteinase nas-13-like isoform X2 [Leptopilina boulardi]
MTDLLMMVITILISGSTTFAWPFQQVNVLDNGLENTNGLIAYLTQLGEKLFSEPNAESGSRVAEWNVGMNVNPEELGEYVEGDILFPSAMGRNGLKATSARWPNGVVPYMISPYFNKEQRNLIQEAMDDYHRHTCIQFKPYEGEETDYIRITAGNTGCWSSVGKIGGRQDINLQVPGCVTKKGTVIHELMHAIGFLHEQSRYERDDFVRVQWNNIQSGREKNFEKASKLTTDAFGINYDYGSVMHYSSGAFSKNGQPTILPRGTIDTKVIGQRVGFSKKDIQKIRRMYKCGSKRSFSLSDFFF